MAPGKSFIDVDQNAKPNYALKVESNQGNWHLLANSNGKGLRNMIKQEETTIAVKGLDDQIKGLEDEEVDIIGCTNESRLAEAEDPDATECSSSFGDTFSDSERCPGMSEAEVESEFYCESTSQSPYDSKSKKLTNHWRNYIRPLMWRCKWTELRIRELDSQDLKYTREVASCDQKKHDSGMDQATVESFGSKSLPFSQNYRRRVMKRRKRKKVEDATNIASYISEHNIFSYLDNRKSNLDLSSMVDDSMNTAAAEQHGVLGTGIDPIFLEFKDGNDSLEPILSKIEMVHAQVQKLRGKLEVVMSKHTAKFSSSENLSLLAQNDVQTSSAPSLTFSAGNGDNLSMGAIYNPGQNNISDYDIGELVLPDGTIYGEAFHIPDIIESTAGRLAATDIKPQIGDSCDNVLNNVLIHNQSAEGESHMFTGTSDHHERENLNVGESSNPLSVSKTEPDLAAATCHEQSVLPSGLATNVNFPTYKRKRGERKAGSGGWKNKSSGEPENQ